MIALRCLIVSLLLTWVSAVASAAESDQAISFNRDIRPILADNCFACHGPDKASRKGDLRLDIREDAVSQGAIVPGDSTNSPLLDRIISQDPDVRMPPPHTKKSLSDSQVQILRDWIRSGARYQPHWAFLPVSKVFAIPTTDQNPAWIRNPIDAYVLSQLTAKSIKPAREATREQWLRRVSFDLNGLPPSLEDLDKFLADESPQAYELAVDRLLERPAFGERMTNDWLDVARFADTFGYQSDREMHVWPWRDWCIRAFNENLPYNQFILWQTAGDMLPDAPRDAALATAFNRLHRQTNEGGSIAEEFRISYVADRVATNGTAFLGLTLECARCHDHKFDPITQRDYYSMAAFFADIDEFGLYSHFTETAPTPAMLLYEGTQQADHLQLQNQIAEKERELAQIARLASESLAAVRETTSNDGELATTPLESSRDAPSRDQLPTANDAEAAKASASTSRKPQSVYSFEELTATDDYRGVPGKFGQAIEFSGDAAFPCKDAGVFDRVTPFSFSMWLKPADSAARRVVLHRSIAAEDAAFRGYSLVLDAGHVAFSLIHFWPGNALRVDTKHTLPVQKWTHIAATYDGSTKASGIKIYINGYLAETSVVRDQLTRDIVYRANWGDSGTPELSLGARFRDSGFAGGALDELQVFDCELSPIEIAFYAGQNPPTDLASHLTDHLLRENLRYQAVAKELLELRRQENQKVGEVRQLMTLAAAQTPRISYILQRGAYDAPGDAVFPDTPTSVLAFPDEFPRNRLGLGRWMIDDRNPLVSRVAVNRIWQIFFGRGLVGSAGDFGSQGQPPTHPELLDWLSRQFMDQGWNVKDLCKLIVLSSTYRQSSIPSDPETLVSDPDNRLLARGPRHRLSAEQIRDNALAISGLLVTTIGGPSVYPYQPEGLWEESGTGKTYPSIKGEGLYRRSLYTFWRRTSPPPAMITLDATSREVCVARREPTGTPTQALILLNDPQFVEAARVLAERLIHHHPGDIEQRIEAAFRLCTSRRPAAEETKVLVRLYEEQRTLYAADPSRAVALLQVGNSPRDEKRNVTDHAATTVLVQALMNFDECVVKR